MKRYVKFTSVALIAVMLLGALSSCGQIKIPQIVDDIINFDYDFDILELETGDKQNKPSVDNGDESEGAPLESESNGKNDNLGDELPESEPSGPSDPGTESESAPTNNVYRKRVLLVTDFHYVSTKNWYEIDPDERMTRMVEDINDEYRKDPFCMIIFMGDYSLDHWQWDSSKPYCTYLKTGVSHTELFMKNYRHLLPDVPMFWLAGNHEQFGEATWKKMVGNSRQGYEVIEDYLIIMWDSFGGGLDPDYHHDGIYTPMDTEWVRSLMDMYPDKKVILISHYFNSEKENGNSNDIVSDKRVIALFAGHNHASNTTNLGADFGYKTLAFAGNYSYYGTSGDPGQHKWGFRDLVLENDMMRSSYIIPENTMVINGETIEVQAAVTNTFARRIA